MKGGLVCDPWISSDEVWNYRRLEAGSISVQIQPWVPPHVIVFSLFI